MSDASLARKWALLLVILASFVIAGCPRREEPAPQEPVPQEEPPPPQPAPPRCVPDTSLGKPVICVGDGLVPDRTPARVWDVEEDPAKKDLQDPWQRRNNNAPVMVRWISQTELPLGITFTDTKCVENMKATCDGKGECTVKVKKINWGSSPKGKSIRCTYTLSGASNGQGDLDVNPCCWP